MSRYVTPASKQVSKIGTLKRGSTAFRRTSARVSRMSAATASSLDASIACALKRPSSRAGSRLAGLDPSTSASTQWSKNGRRRAIWAKAAPTPPVPTTKILTVLHERPQL
jgi:hypothetical protein